MRSHFFWVNGAVREVNETELDTFVRYGDGNGNLCVDCGASSTETTYGYYNKIGSWSHVPYDQFPAEFKTHLLLLGITP